MIPVSMRPIWYQIYDIIWGVLANNSIQEKWTVMQVVW